MDASLARQASVSLWVGRGVLVVGEFDGGDLPGGEVVEGLEFAVGQDQDVDLFVLFQRLLGLLVEPADLDIAEVQLSAPLLHLRQLLLYLFKGAHLRFNCYMVKNN